MKKCSLYLVFTILFVASAHAQNKTDEVAVRAIPQAFVAAWAKHDAHELAKVMSENVDFVNISADWLHGRQNFELYHTRLFAGVNKHTEITQLDAVVRFLRPDVAVVDWSWSLKDEDAPKSEPHRGMFMMIVEKRAGGWLVADAENTPHFEGGILTWRELRLRSHFQRRSRARIENRAGPARDKIGAHFIASTTRQAQPRRTEQVCIEKGFASIWKDRRSLCLITSVGR